MTHFMLFFIILLVCYGAIGGRLAAKQYMRQNGYLDKWEEIKWLLIFTFFWPIVEIIRLFKNTNIHW